MDDSTEARNTLAGIISSQFGRLPLKSVLHTLARDLELGERRVRAIYHGEARRVEAGELDRIRIYAVRKHRFPPDIEQRVAALEATVFGS